MEFLIWIQDTVFSTWLRESDWALFALLIVHTIGMAFLSGTGMVVALRILGIAPQVPLSLLSRFVPVMMLGLIAAILSGVLLVVSYPAKALTNPLFYIKLAILTIALLVTRRIVKHITSNSQFDLGPLPDSLRRRAMLSLALWAFGITAGKFLAYTNTMLLVYQ